MRVGDRVLFTGWLLELSDDEGPTGLGTVISTPTCQGNPWCLAHGEVAVEFCLDSSEAKYGLTLLETELAIVEAEA